MEVYRITYVAEGGEMRTFDTTEASPAAALARFNSYRATQRVRRVVDVVTLPKED